MVWPVPTGGEDTAAWRPVTVGGPSASGSRFQWGWPEAPDERRGGW